MKTTLLCLALSTGLSALAQTTETVVEDFKPSSLNQPGKQYPQVNSERRVRARVVAPQAQSVVFEYLGGAKYPLAKSDDGAWVGVTRPQDEGFHYYQLVIDGAGVPDPGTLYFYGGNRWGSGVEIPAHDGDFYALKDVPHGQLRQTLFFSRNANATHPGHLRGGQVPSGHVQTRHEAQILDGRRRRFHGSGYEYPSQ